MEEYAKKSDSIREVNHISLVDKIKSSKEKVVPVDEESQAAAIAQAMVGSDLDAPDHLLRASELAKILKIKTKELIDRAQEMGIEISNARSVLSPEQIEFLKEKI